jgi:hypothetical protein
VCGRVRVWGLLTVHPPPPSPPPRSVHARRDVRTPPIPVVYFMLRSYAPKDTRVLRP